MEDVVVKFVMRLANAESVPICVGPFDNPKAAWEATSPFAIRYERELIPLVDPGSIGDLRERLAPPADRN